MNDDVLITLILAIEHLAYEPPSGVFVQRRMEDGSLMSMAKWHRMEAHRLLTLARKQLVGPPIDVTEVERRQR